jgi:hypothetical protein
MAGTCPYCGAPLNFGLKFCIVCGRQSGDVANKMVNLRVGARQAEAVRHGEDSSKGKDYQAQKKTLRFGNKVKAVVQTSIYGCIAGTLFFCAIKVALEVNVVERVTRITAPIVEPIVQKCQEVTTQAKNLVMPEHNVNSASKKADKGHKAAKKRKKGK